MTDWRNQSRLCGCGKGFQPKREGQRHCSASCRDAAKKRLKRSGDKSRPLTQLPRSGDTPATSQSDGLSDGPTMVWPERDFHQSPTPGALQGDDYPLDYYPDGYPKLPTCLDRRLKPEPLAEAA
jgi:hypothetical protein